MELLAKPVADVVEALSSLPGVGKKTALRLALHLLSTEEAEVQQLSAALKLLRERTMRCQVCNNISEEPTCPICSSHRRERGYICVVADIQDLIAIEKTGQYNGLYHVLGGLISPLEGVSPADLAIERLVARAGDAESEEVIFALSASMEGETTAFYLAKQLKNSAVRISNIARGIPLGNELEYTDEMTIARSIQQRTRYALPE